MPHTPSSDIATVSEIARHLVLTNDTTRRLLKENGIEPVALQPMRFRWRDVWARLEGTGYVPPERIEEFRKPLLKPADVRRRFLPHLKERAIRDRAAKCSLPGVKLGTEWRFRECDVREASIHG
jgi:hypothetical protein